MEVISRKKAKELGYKWFFTGTLCKKGHIDKRLTSNGKCYTCSKDDYKNWYSNNSKKRSEDFKAWVEKNKDIRSEYMREYLKEWKQDNNGKVNAAVVARKHLILARTPSWANLKTIEDIYIKSSQISKSTGIIHHVDHIVPLQNDLVCGLHVEWNLQIITAEENLRKHNRFEIS
jgi:hypothetical protein